MAHKVIDRCKETTSTTGTGTLTLTGAVANFVAMADATAGLTVDGDTSWFCAENGAEWEVFLGTRVDATHLARTTVISSSNAGAAVSFTVAPTVFGTVPASKLLAPSAPVFRAVRATSNQSVTTDTATKVQFNSEQIDTAACFDNATNYRFTPTVAGYYAVQWAVKITAADALSYVDSALYKNGATYASGTSVDDASGTLYAAASSGSAVVLMNGSSDYLEVFTYISNGVTANVSPTGGRTYFSGHYIRPA